VHDFASGDARILVQVWSRCMREKVRKTMTEAIEEAKKAKGK